MSEWHEANKHQIYFEKQLSKDKSRFHNWYCQKMIWLCKTLKRWIAEEQTDRRNWDD